MWVWLDVLSVTAWLAVALLMLQPLLSRVQNRCVLALCQPVRGISPTTSEAEPLYFQLYWPLAGQAEHVVQGLDCARLWRYPRAYWQLLLHSEQHDDAGLIVADCLQQPGFRQLPVRWLSAAQRPSEGLHDDSDILLLNPPQSLWEPHWLSEISQHFARAPLAGLQLSPSGWAVRVGLIRPWLQRGVEPARLPALLAAQGYELHSLMRTSANNSLARIQRAGGRVMLRACLATASVLRWLRPSLGVGLLALVLFLLPAEALGALWLSVPLALWLLRPQWRRWRQAWRRFNLLPMPASMARVN
ncbi:hypothetical protein [Atopomonas sediminilitoris]|uniref:hypothetical protein n=1 Tax=Atopomonas sediminilitoris TaxID=2919919 RepID=UPI001F4D4289|nr:hypothetical protein [Atopomonas sediminilitoris]MCJ8167724.1 hypothetical protein [Atopomonas sediminilitoris]